MTSSSTGANTSRVRGTSPVKTSRGNSASPKIRAWQSNIPGFSSEAPPNLRTSLADRPASYVRGSSPASRNGTDFSSRPARQSMSPTASRSISSSLSHDRDLFSSQSKGSVVSSGDDDMESLPSTTIGSTDRSALRNVGAFSSRGAYFSKKPNKTVSSSSAPKRSFDLALRQMEQRKVPQNMFRPLLSSVPSSTFYAGKASNSRTMLSRNSSVTSSSNASSDLGTSGAHDNEGNDRNREDITTGHIDASNLDEEDELFVFDKADNSNEGNRDSFHGGPSSNHRNDFNSGLILHSQSGFESLMPALGAGDDCTDTAGLSDMSRCSKCGNLYHAIESLDNGLKLCPECRKLDLSLTSSAAVTEIFVEENSTVSLSAMAEEDAFDPLEPQISVPESLGVTSVGDSIPSQPKNLGNGPNSCTESISGSLLENPLAQANQPVMGYPGVLHGVLASEAGGEKMPLSGEFSNLKADISDAAGISILLKRSTSAKGPVVQSRHFSASSISYDDLSCIRGSTTSMRSSFGHGSMSASSSIDMGSAKQTENHFQRQLSSRKSDVENYRYEMNAKLQHSGSSLSGTSSYVFQPSSLGTSTHDWFEASEAIVESDVTAITSETPQEQLLASESKEVDDTNNCPEVSSGQTDVNLGENSINFEDSASFENVKDLEVDKNNVLDVEISAMASAGTSDLEEDNVPDLGVDGGQRSLDTISEVEIENAYECVPDSRCNAVSNGSKSSMDESEGHPVLALSDKDVGDMVEEHDISDYLNEEPAVLVGDQSSPVQEAAAEMIHSLHSIDCNMASTDAIKEVKKENAVPPEAPWPLIPAIGKSNSNRNGPRSRDTSKRNSKTKRSNERRVETDTKPPTKTKFDDEPNLPAKTRLVGVPNNVDNMKPPKLESKCNCTIM